MKHVLDNPVYRALRSGDQPLSFGNDNVKFFDKQVSPFAGFEQGYENGFADLYDLLPSGRNILYATPSTITHPAGWTVLQDIKGLQFVYETDRPIKNEFSNIIPLGQIHVDQMMELAALTKPGPFGPRTIDLETTSEFLIMKNSWR